MASAQSKDSLPIFQAIRVTSKSFVAGHPSQIVDLLSSGVATAVLRGKNNSNVAMYECLLRCPLLAPNVNLPVYFCLDHQNQHLIVDTGVVCLQLPHENSNARDSASLLDEERGQAWSAALTLALSYWEVKMEEAVIALYPNRVPKQVDQYSSKGLIEMKVWGETDVPALLSICTRRGGFPCFKLAYTWIGSKEDPRSKEHVFGMKFDFSSYGQYPVTPRTRKPAATASERQEQLLKKRKSEDAAVAPEETVEPVV